ncbi:MAG TPA: dipeptide/oligopeptide/nickel ABC transporter permease/ATP-binding protein [Acidimicrobiales bacterium]|nr:dipeptide/oligopeptide/nickel ABC transporter permease/ATP-binding protein [Acidimicrobiales bacterium]
MSVADQPDGHVAAPSLSTVGVPVAEPVKATRSARWWSRLAANTGALVALGYLVLVIVAAMTAPLIAPHSPTAQDLTQANSGPSLHHWLGTDDLGRDILSRLIYGAQISMRVSFEVVGLALCAAIPIGLVAGYVGGQLDNVLMRVMDAGLSFPPLVLALAIAGVLGPGVNNAALAIAVVFIPTFARLIRGQALAVSAETFVEASRAIGSRSWFILLRRVFPNVLSPLLVQVSLGLGGALLAEAGLSFLGLGAQPPAASWGSMLREAYDNSLFTASWELFIPGAAIALAVLAFNTLGDGLGEVLGLASRRRRSPRWRRRMARPVKGLTTVARPAQPSRPPSAGRSALLSIEGLTVELDADGRSLRVVEDVWLRVERGEIVGLVGESGSGKTVTSLAVMRLLPSPPATIVGGVVEFDGRDLLSLDFDDMRKVRGREIAMVFQDPMTSLNPAFTVGSQLIEALRLHERVDRRVARKRALELLQMVEIPDPARRLDAYPHQLSGGMRQRVVIAMALACGPRLLIADEPTTALDVTVQAQILDLLRRLQEEQDLAVIFVTHDLGVVADLCDRVAVMYAGQIVEDAPAADLFAVPKHPYTEGLLAATPSTQASGGILVTIPGQVPSLGHMPAGCRFHPRCPYARAACQEAPPPVAAAGGRLTRCIRWDDVVLKGAP